MGINEQHKRAEKLFTSPVFKYESLPAFSKFRSMNTKMSVL